MDFKLYAKVNKYIVGILICVLCTNEKQKIKMSNG